MMEQQVGDDWVRRLDVILVEKMVTLVPNISYPSHASFPTHNRQLTADTLIEGLLVVFKPEMGDQILSH